MGRDPGARARPGPAPASGPDAHTGSAGRGDLVIRPDADTRPGPATAPGAATPRRGAPADPTGPPDSAGVTGLSGAAGLTGFTDPTGLTDPTDTARVLLLRAARATPGTLDRLYHQGTAAERRAVLLALPYLPGIGPAAVPLIEDALRANDTRLIAAAVGPYAARHLGPHAWRHAVLKCLFTEVPVAAVAGLAGRARGDAELARMLTDYARERTAAGRPVPPDLHHVLALTAAGTEPEPEPAAAESPVTGPPAMEPAATEPSRTEPAATEEP
ncbi:EboA domain-containing protein [Streptomyces xinghaiensis]|uniref:EboA domain-containing protein n=1 Tax=Streptomyces xinghaiensis TaxID=1038928 RepID=UPI002E13B41B|nr:EboA domain-containing protein [Streptomyces xinghaiensis]